MRTLVNHPIQEYILSQLYTHKYLRFRDMRPNKVDTNLYSYHLKIMQNRGMLEKLPEGYTLNFDGMLEAERLLNRANSGPEVSLMLVIQDGYGATLLLRQITQPFIDNWSLPTLRLDSLDTIGQVASQLFKKYFDGQAVNIRHAGDCYLRYSQTGQIKQSKLVHVFYGTIEQAVDIDGGKWVPVYKLTAQDLSPGVEQILTRTFFRDEHFFEEYEVEV